MFDTFQTYTKQNGDLAVSFRVSLKGVEHPFEECGAFHSLGRSMKKVLNFASGGVPYWPLGYAVGLT